MREAWEPSKKQGSFAKREALGIKILSFSYASKAFIGYMVNGRGIIYYGENMYSVTGCTITHNTLYVNLSFPGSHSAN
jgi:hypothetical protein